MTTNDRIDKLLSEIFGSDKYVYREKSSFKDDIGEKLYQEYRTYLILMTDDLKLITNPFGSDHQVRLTPFGQKVCEKGGWIKHLEKIELLEKFNFHAAKWKYYTFWIWFILAIFGGGYSAYDFIERLSKAKYDQQEKIPKAELESEVSRSHSLVLDHRSLDSLHRAKSGEVL